MNLYILGPGDGGEGAYYILTEEGECLASHYCSDNGHARIDLEEGRPERQKAWKERFGEYKVFRAGENGMSEEELLKRNSNR